MDVARILSFVAAAFATLEWAPGAGNVAALDALGLVETAKVRLGHVEGGGGRKLLWRPIAVGDRGSRSRGVASRLAAGGRR